MKIDTEANRLYPSQRVQTSTAASANPSPFSSALAAATTETPAVKQADFTNMTRREMFDWMNDQIRSGEMSLDESSPFLGMTMKISVATGQPVDISTDATRINFIEKAHLGIEAARSRNDPDLAQRLRTAIEVMRRQQGQALGIDARA
ncbi:MAG TPA: hypothetical protein PKB14_09335 [Rubrivivax sp.]|nr:hypothetical protein [Rubrivivax sp.]